MLAVKGALVGLLVAGAYLHDYVLGPGLARQIREGRPQSLRPLLTAIGRANLAAHASPSRCSAPCSPSFCTTERRAEQRVVLQDDVDLAALVALRRARSAAAGRPAPPSSRSSLAVACGRRRGARRRRVHRPRRSSSARATSHSLRPVSLGSNSFLFASDGSLLGVIPSATNRQPLRLDQMSPWLPKATVAIEDSRFWQHGALDYQGIARALYKDANAGRIVQGGSTITQQLVRNLYIGKAERTFSRKVKEACLAEKLAQIWTKKQILAALPQRGLLRPSRVRRAGRRADVLLDERAAS